VIYEGVGEGPEQAKDRTHFTLKPLGPGQKYSFKIRVRLKRVWCCSNTGLLAVL